MPRITPAPSLWSRSPAAKRATSPDACSQLDRQSVDLVDGLLDRATPLAGLVVWWPRHRWRPVRCCGLSPLWWNPSRWRRSPPDPSPAAGAGPLAGAAHVVREVIRRPGRSVHALFHVPIRWRKPSSITSRLPASCAISSSPSGRWRRSALSWRMRLTVSLTRAIVDAAAQQHAHKTDGQDDQAPQANISRLKPRGLAGQLVGDTWLAGALRPARPSSTRVHLPRSPDVPSPSTRNTFLH